MKTEPLTFRLYQSIRFNRPINKEDDWISPGGYAFEMKDEDGITKEIQFDFEDYEGQVDKEDPCVVHCMQKNPDYDVFHDLNTLTEHMLRNIKKVTEWFIYTGEPCETEPLIPVDVFDAAFVIISPEADIKIPITKPIKAFSNYYNHD